MAAAVDRQLASRDQPVHHPRVDGRDDRIVVPRQYQGGLTYQRQQREAGPAEDGQRLVAIASGPYELCRGAQQLTGERRVVAHAAAVELTSDAGRTSMVAIAPRPQHAEQSAWVAGHHQAAWRASHQHESAYPCWAQDGEMLRQGASPGDAQDIGLLVAELVEQVTHQRRQCGQVVRNYRWLGPADARHVEPDDFSLGVERVDERLQQLEAGADAIAQHQRRPLGFPLRTVTRRLRPPAISVPVDVRSGELMARARRWPARPHFPGPPGWSGSLGGHRFSGQRWLRMPVRVVVALPSRPGRLAGSDCHCLPLSGTRQPAQGMRQHIKCQAIRRRGPHAGRESSAASPATGCGRREGYSAFPATTKGPLDSP